MSQHDISKTKHFSHHRWEVFKSIVEFIISWTLAQKFKLIIIYYYVFVELATKFSGQMVSIYQTTNFKNFPK